MRGFCSCHFGDTVTITLVSGDFQQDKNPWSYTAELFSNSGCLTFDNNDVIRNMTEKAGVSTELS